MSKLFILGSGFSKAVFPDEMPLMNELASCIEPEINNYPNKEIYKKFGTDIEGLMTYLHQEVPWKSDYDSKIDEGLLLKLLNKIGEYITECEEKAFEKVLPPWAKQFIEYIHEKELTVATFNYDTILERLSEELKYKHDPKNAINIIEIYRIPISSLPSRTNSTGFSYGALQGYRSSNTYRLLKLHGSINWYFTRDDGVLGTPVYYTKVDEDRNAEEIKRNIMGLTTLIIPPVAEKSSFYNTQLIKILWTELAKAVDGADEIYCVGYSLPKSDYTTQIFFKTVIDKDKRKVYIVNRKCGSDDLIKNYREALPNCELIEDYITDDDPVEKMVMDLK